MTRGSIVFHGLANQTRGALAMPTLATDRTTVRDTTPLEMTTAINPCEVPHVQFLCLLNRALAVSKKVENGV